MEANSAADGTRIARFTAFATIGSLNVVQQMAGAVLESIDGAAPDLVAEETLCLVSTATSRATAVGWKAVPDVAEATSAAILDIPFIYRDYLMGGELLDSGDRSLIDAADDVYARLQRKREFYRVHFPPNQFPGERALNDKMGLWMGRISPPGLPELPTERLAKLNLVEQLLTHLKLVLAFARNGA